MKISFCTTCMGRLHHLQKTLPQNITNNLPRAGSNDPAVEFVVLDYSSRDGLRDWILNDPLMQDYMERGIVRYAHYAGATHFNRAHAKNLAHRLATGDVVCNLDADNFTGPRFAALLADRFAVEPRSVQHMSYALMRRMPYDAWGCFGRISMGREEFIQLGGYDEAKYSDNYGWEDVDLILRAFAHGLKSFPVADGQYLGTLPHTMRNGFVILPTRDNTKRRQFCHLA